MKLLHDTCKDLETYDEPKKPRYTACANGFCGGEDCQNCRPGNFLDGVFVDDIEKEEP